MEDPFVIKLWAEADQLLFDADEELTRPEEDVVSHLICGNSRQAIYKYLTGYLLKNGVEPNSPPTMASLLQQCQVLDKKFDSLDFSTILCRFDEHDQAYCLDIDEVDSCFQVAQRTKKLVKN